MSAPVYAPVQRVLHWVVAIMVAMLATVGFIMAERAEANIWDATTNTMYSNHKLAGFILLCIVAVRIVVRVVKGRPEPVSTLTPMQRIGSESVHGLIYVLLVVTPMLGWIGVSAFGARGVPGGWSLPEIVAVDKDFAKRVLEWHGWAATALVILALAHLGAALYHRIVLKDGVFRRMWPEKGA
jgi:cytochrome b561